MDYSLQIYYNPKLSSQVIENDIAPIAKNWRRSIRLLGGYWQGSFNLEGDYDKLSAWFNSYIGHRIVETIGSQVTWEGLIYEMTLDDTKETPSLRVTCCGYAHTMNWRYLSVGDDTSDDLSDWMDLILSTDCEFVVYRNLMTNTLQVVKATEMKRRAFDELSRLVAMGDSSGNMYRMKMTADRRVLYNTVSKTPEYYCYGGLIRRASLDTMYNYIAGEYIDESDEVQELSASSNAGSIAVYGRKELRLVENNVPQDAMEKLQATVLQENAYPWGRVVSCSQDIEFFDTAGMNRSIAPWFIEPAVVRDLKFPNYPAQSGSVFESASDFLVDEIEVAVGRDGRPSLSLKTAATEESDMLEAYYRELYDQREGDKGAGGKNHVPREDRRGTKEYHEKYMEGSWDDTQLDWWKDQGYDWTWEGRKSEPLVPPKENP